MPESELTQLHGQVLEALDLAGVAYEAEYAISVQGQDYQLDCYLPDYLACIEADGPSHGMRGRKDRVRDALLESAGIPTLRLPWKLINSEKVKGIAKLIQLWLLSIAGDIGDRRKRRVVKDALWD